MKSYHVMLGLLLLTGFTNQSHATAAEERAFAAKCDAAIGVTVPAFDCEDGTLVPTTLDGKSFQVEDIDGNLVNADESLKAFKLPLACDRPNALNKTCDPGSKFQVLVNTPDAFVVAHCRRKGNPKGVFADIAVIQHNKATGATCFYQNDFFGPNTPGAFGDPDRKSNHQVKAPSSGKSNIFGQTEGCLTCHDNGPLIRSPYLSQIVDMDTLADKINILPGSRDKTYNNGTKPYYIVGNENLKTYAVVVKDNPCKDCHTLSVWYNKDDFSDRDASSAGQLALDATSHNQGTSVKKISSNSPVWMSKNGLEQITSASDSRIAKGIEYAEEVEACARKFNPSNPTAATEKCSFVKNKGRANPSSSFINIDGKCLELSSTNSVVPKPCVADKTSQKWKMNTNKTISAKNENRCLIVDSTIADGMRVKTATCDADEDRQKWKYDAFKTKISNVFVDNKSDDDKCLEPGRTTGAASDNRIQLGSCDATLSRKQMWAFQDLEFKFIRHYVEHSSSLNIEFGEVVANEKGDDVLSKAWALEKSGDYYRIHNKEQADQYLAVENDLLVTKTLDASDDSALWIIRNRPEAGQDEFTIQNKEGLQPYIHLERTNTDPESTNTDPEGTKLQLLTWDNGSTESIKPLIWKIVPATSN